MTKSNEGTFCRVLQRRGDLTFLLAKMRRNRFEGIEKVHVYCAAAYFGLQWITSGVTWPECRVCKEWFCQKFEVKSNSVFMEITVFGYVLYRCRFVELSRFVEFLLVTILIFNTIITGEQLNI